MICKEKFRLPYNLQFFAEDTSDGDEGTPSNVEDLNALLTQLGGNADTNTAESNEEPAEEAEPTTQKPEQQPQNKQEYAFAQMRVQNNQLMGLIGKIAQAAGIDYKDDTDLISKLNDDAITKLAEKQNVPVELLKRMEHLEQRDKLYQAEQLKGAAFAGFQKIKSTYELTDDELRTFAKELDESGKNPFFNLIDIESEYKLTHFDDIIAKKAQAAVQAALAKSSAADTHSTKPNNVKGKPDENTGDKVTTVSGLNALLKDM